jgi:hypothetical protein
MNWNGIISVASLIGIVALMWWDYKQELDMRKKE